MIWGIIIYFFYIVALEDADVGLAIRCLGRNAPWIGILLCETLLDSYDDMLTPQEFQNEITPCSMKKIVTRYFYLLPPHTSNREANPACDATR